MKNGKRLYGSCKICSESCRREREYCLKGILAILTTCGVLSNTDGTYIVLYNAADAFMLFLPVFVGFSAAKVFDASPILMMTICAAMLSPTLIAYVGGEEILTFLKIPVSMVNYQNTFFPAIAACWLGSKVEKIAKKILPEMLHLMFVPMFAILITVPIVLIIVGPIINWISNGLASGITSLIALNPTIAGIIVGALWQMIVLTGLHLCAIGVYEVYINDVKVGDEFLSPGYHSYDLHLQAQTYDVTDYIKKGSNTIKIMTGNGWYKGRIGFRGGYTDVYGDRCRVISELYLTDADGNPRLITTDENWNSYPSPVVHAGIYDGEVYDARLEKTDVYYPVEESIPESCGKLEDRWSLPIRKMETLPVKELIHTPKDEWVLDFGQNLTGWVEFICDLPEGESICLTAGEILQNDCFYRENYRTAKAEFKYVSNGKKEKYGLILLFLDFGI